MLQIYVKASERVRADTVLQPVVKCSWKSAPSPVGTSVLWMSGSVNWVWQGGQQWSRGTNPLSWPNSLPLSADSRRCLRRCATSPSELPPCRCCRNLAGQEHPAWFAVKTVQKKDLHLVWKEVSSLKRTNKFSVPRVVHLYEVIRKNNGNCCLVQE